MLSRVGVRLCRCAGPHGEPIMRQCRVCSTLRFDHDTNEPRIVAAVLTTLWQIQQYPLLPVP